MVVVAVVYLAHSFYHMNSDCVVHAVVVCLSVHPSVTSWYCITTAECMITQTMPHDNPATPNFLMPRIVLTLEL